MASLLAALAHFSISDDDSPGFHQIYLDGRPHPKDADPLWYGHSIGHWEGDTLVVDRVNFEDQVWLDQAAHPHSDKLHVIERYSRVDLGHLETEVTVEDPRVFLSEAVYHEREYYRNWRREKRFASLSAQKITGTSTILSGVRAR